MNKITEDIGSGKAGPGRPKGSPNKTTKIAKEAIAYAAEGLGGADRLVAWAKEDAKNEAAFWTQIYPKLLPLQVNADVNATISEIRHRIIDSASD
jgi:hypothetical protein